MRHFTFSLLTITLLSSLASAKVTNPEYKVEGKLVKFFENRDLGVLTSKSCPELEKNKLCKHLEFLEKLDINSADIPNGGGLNYGSIACKTTLKNKIYMGHDLENNEITFCKHDGYFIDVGTLDYYVSKNRGLISKSHRRSK